MFYLELLAGDEIPEDAGYSRTVCRWLL